MATKTKLGEHYVRFTAEGLKQAEQDTSKTAKKVETTWGNLHKAITKKFQGGFGAIGKGLFAVAAPAAGLLALGAGVTILSFAFSGLAAVAGLTWAVLTAPIVLTVAAIIAVGVAIATLVGVFGDGSENMATNMNNSTSSWVGSFLKGLKNMSVKGAELFNWLADKAAKTSDWIADKLAWAAEGLGLVPEGTRKLMGEMEKIKPLSIDVEKLKKDMDGFARKATDPANWDAARKAVIAIGDGVKEVTGMFGKNGAMKFTPQMDVGFESLQGSFDRLAVEFAKGTPDDLLKDIRDQAKGFNDKLERLIEKVGGAINAVVGP